MRAEQPVPVGGVDDADPPGITGSGDPNALHITAGGDAVVLGTDTKQQVAGHLDTPPLDHAGGVEPSLGVVGEVAAAGCGGLLAQAEHVPHFRCTLVQDQ